MDAIRGERWLEGAAAFADDPNTSALLGVDDDGRTNVSYVVHGRVGTLRSLPPGIAPVPPTLVSNPSPHTR